tara:strand:- start:79 stop:204 length:126 start_codon:yes stop_codon:yes gene_type:complete
MSNKKKTPEFDIADDTPTTSDGDCPCIAKGERDIACQIHGG